MRKSHIDRPVFRKSTYSGAANSNCVEVTLTDEGADMKIEGEDGSAVLHFTTDEWTAFETGVLNREFDRP
jgi:Domain of unknown function (DUF397)